MRGAGSLSQSTTGSGQPHAFIRQGTGITMNQVNNIAASLADFVAKEHADPQMPRDEGLSIPVDEMRRLKVFRGQTSTELKVTFIRQLSDLTQQQIPLMAEGLLAYTSSERANSGAIGSLDAEGAACLTLPLSSSDAGVVETMLTQNLAVLDQLAEAILATQEGLDNFYRVALDVMSKGDPSQADQKGDQSSMPMPGADPSGWLRG